jgi:ABC-type uncharacterized transport system ATPase subunit
LAVIKCGDEGDFFATICGGQVLDESVIKHIYNDEAVKEVYGGSLLAN